MTVGNPIKVTDLSVLSQNVVFPGLVSVALNTGGLGGILLEFSLQIVLEPFSEFIVLGGISFSFLEPPKLVLEGGGLL